MPIARKTSHPFSRDQCDFVSTNLRLDVFFVVVYPHISSRFSTLSFELCTLLAMKLAFFLSSLSSFPRKGHRKAALGVI